MNYSPVPFPRGAVSGLWKSLQVTNKCRKIPHVQDFLTLTRSSSPFISDFCRPCPSLGEGASGLGGSKAGGSTIGSGPGQITNSSSLAIAGAHHLHTETCFVFTWETALSRARVGHSGQKPDLAACLDWAGARPGWCGSKCAQPLGQGE